MKTKPNNRFCEATRLYQAIALKVPVIVGNNEYMAKVDKNKLVIVMLSNVSLIEELKESTNKLLSNYGAYKSNCREHFKDYIWSDDFVNFDWFE